ncbi:MAG TPA: DUF2341 domain-containing protein [Clostridiales bacterium]|nr:DUF2341 domain-containing protein [Clostridiales bacterium]HQP70636.1 DUF2341 domain-containing protein [Clostridiales bacterium]
MKIKFLLSLAIIALVIIISCDTHEFTSPFDSDYWSGKEITPPATLTKTDLEIDKVRLNWTLSVNDYPEGYKFRIDKKIGSGAWKEKYLLVKPDQLSLTDTAEINQTLNYRIYISYDENISEPKELSYVNTFPAPTNLTTQQVTITNAKIMWNDNSKGEEKFTIERKISTVSEYQMIKEIEGDNLTTKFYNDTTVAPGTEYDYRITAVKGSDKSGSVVKRFLNLFQAPTGLTAIQNNVYTFTLNWTDNSNGEDGFKVERKIDGGAYSVIATVTGTNYVDNTVSKGYETVYYQVRAYKGTTYFSNYSQTNSVVSFPAPSNLSATQTSIISANLSWTDNSTGEDKFEIDRKISTESTYVKIAEVNGSDTATKSWVDNTVIPNLTYDYRVRAIKGLNNSEYVLKTLANTFQSPSGLTAIQNNVYTFTLNWTDNSNGEDGFKVERKIDGGAYSVIATVTGTNYVDNTVSKGYGTVYYQVRAYKGTTYFSNYSQTNLVVSFPAPTNVQIDQVTITSAKITWNDNSLGEDKFVIERKLSSETVYNPIKEITGDNLTTKNWTDTSLTANLTYNYRIKAVKGINESAYLTSSNYYNEFRAPTGLASVQVNPVAATISWNDTYTGEDRYELWRKLTTESDVAYQKVTDVAGSDTETKNYTDASLTPNLNYNYKVRIVDGTAYSSFTTAITHNNPFLAPNGLKAFVIDQTSIKLDWNDNSSMEQGYILQRKDGDAGAWNDIKTLGANTVTWTDTALTLGIRYYYRVYAYYSSYPTSYSNEISATAGVSLFYWIEDTSKVWIKVPEIPANSIVTLSLTKAGSEVPNGDSTFVFFDDGKTDKMPNTGGPTYEKYKYTNNLTFPTNWVLEWSQYVVSRTYATYGAINSIIIGGGFPNLSFAISSNTYARPNNDMNVGVTGGTNFDDIYVPTVGRWEKGIIKKNSSTYYFDFFDPNGVSIASRSTSSTATPTINQIGFRVYRSDYGTWYLNHIQAESCYEIYAANGGNGGPIKTKYKNIFIRNYTQTIPAISTYNNLTYYNIEINNTGGGLLKDFQISINAADIDGVTNEQSLQIYSSTK